MSDETPVLQVRGNPTDDEVGALVLVLAALRQPDADRAPTAPVSGWTDRSAGLRTMLRPGPDAWRLSARR